MQARAITRFVALPVVALGALGLAACTNSEVSSNSPGTTPSVLDGTIAPVVVALKNNTGQSVGEATFAQDGDKVNVTVKASDLTPGFHGMHIHTNPVCTPNTTDPSKAFTSAGGHWTAPGTSGHPASGDLPSLLINKDGTGNISFTTEGFTLKQLMAGTSIVIHSGPDNFANIPARYGRPDNETLATGDSGSRVACGVITSK